jgi:hypothetical protein
MASFGSGFASGMGQGMAMGRMLMDTYNDYDQKDKLKKAGEVDQEVIDGQMTADQQAQLKNIRDTKNADGTAAYVVEDVAGGGARFRAAGDENAEWGALAAAKQYKLGNQTRDREFSKDEISRARTDAMADVYMRSGDPNKALGLKALSREDRKGAQWEDINQNQINDLQALAEGNYDALKGTIEKGIQRYNDAQSGQYADGHRIAVDWKNNQAIVTGPKNEVVRTIPITQQTAAGFIRSYYDDLRSAANPEYGLKSREADAGERRAGAAEKSANAAWEHYRQGGTAERIAGIAAASRGDAMNKPNVRMAQVNVTDDQGVTAKMPVSVVTQVGKTGVPVVQAYSLDGKPINDKKVMSQLAGSDDGGLSTSGRNADLSAARDAFKSGNMDYSTYQNTVSQITQTYDRKDALNTLNNEFKTVEKNEGREAAVRSVVAQVESSIKNPKDREAVYGQLGLKQDEVNRIKRGKTGVTAASTYSPQSTWQPGQRRIPENMQGQ